MSTVTHTHMYTHNRKSHTNHTSYNSAAAIIYTCILFPPALVHEPILELFMTTAQGGHLLVHPPGLSEPIIKEAIQMNIHTPIALDKMSRNVFHVQYTHLFNFLEKYTIIKSNIDNPSEQLSVSTFNTILTIIL